MTTRARDMFVTFDEFGEWMIDLTNKLSLDIILDSESHNATKRWHEDLGELTNCSQVFLAAHIPKTQVTEDAEINAAKHGWVVASVPRTTNNQLLISRIGARSDWWNSSTGTIVDNNQSIFLFDRIWKLLKSHLMYPVWARNINSGPARPYRDLGYTSGAKQWASAGGRLAQEGVANIVYEIHDE
jgi:hypothetical protein